MATNPEELTKTFFVNYQHVRKIKVKILGTSGPARAHEILDNARSDKAA